MRYTLEERIDIVFNVYKEQYVYTQKDIQISIHGFENYKTISMKQ